MARTRHYHHHNHYRNRNFNHHHYHDAHPVLSGIGMLAVGLVLAVIGYVLYISVV